MRVEGWESILLKFLEDYKVILFDHVGAGHSDHNSYSREKYDSLLGYAEDILEICEELDLKDVILVGHSVSSMIAAITSNLEPSRFSNLIMIGPSARYINDDGYVGGFDPQDIDELMQALDSNYLGWSANIAPAIMGNPERPELGEELSNSFCRTNPEIAKHFAKVTFLSDNRKDLKSVVTPTLVLQCSQDIIAPVEVGHYINDNLQNSEIHILDATGHCPNLSAPEETTLAIKKYLASTTS